MKHTAKYEIEVELSYLSGFSQEAVRFMLQTYVQLMLEKNKSQTLELLNPGQKNYSGYEGRVKDELLKASLEYCGLLENIEQIKQDNYWTKIEAEGLEILKKEGLIK